MPNFIYVFLISMLPFIELRGAIPAGAVLGLPFYVNFPIAVVANLIPVPFILLFIPKILEFLKRFKFFRPIVEWLHKKAYHGSQKILKSNDGETNNENMKITGIFLGLMLFVALPLPTTGAWTGSLVASLFNFPKKTSFFAIALGVLLCGIIMTLASYGIVGFLSFLAK